MFKKITALIFAISLFAFSSFSVFAVSTNNFLPKGAGWLLNRDSTSPYFYYWQDTQNRGCSSASATNGNKVSQSSRFYRLGSFHAFNKNAVIKNGSSFTVTLSYSSFNNNRSFLAAIHDFTKSNNMADYFRCFALEYTGKTLDVIRTDYQTTGDFFQLDISNVRTDFQSFVSFEAYTTYDIYSLCFDYTIDKTITLGEFDIDIGVVTGGFYCYAFSPVNFGINITNIDKTEEEREEEAGKDAVGDVSDSIDTSSADSMLDAFQALISPLSYSGRNAVWKFPALKIPELPNITPEGGISLSSEYDINLLFFGDSIPKELLIVMRCLGDIAIVYFCFKELEGLYDYALTLKGGNSDG